VTLLEFLTQHKFDEQGTKEVESLWFKNQKCPCGQPWYHRYGCGWRAYKAQQTRLWNGISGHVKRMRDNREIDQEDLEICLVMLAGFFTRDLDEITRLTGVMKYHVRLYAERFDQYGIWRAKNVVWFGHETLDTDIPLICNLLVGKGGFEVEWDEHDNGCYMIAGCVHPTKLAQLEDDGCPNFELVVVEA